MNRNILLANIPFLDKVGSKIRPVLQLTQALDKYGNIQVAYITSIIHSDLLPTDILINDLDNTGLIEKSLIRTSKIFTIAESNIDAILGNISEEVNLNVDKALKYQFNLK